MRDLGYRVRRLPQGGAIVLHPDGLTWASDPTGLHEAGRLALRLNSGGGEDVGDDELASRLEGILDRLAGPDDVRLPMPASRRWAVPQAWRGVFDQAIR